MTRTTDELALSAPEVFRLIEIMAGAPPSQALVDALHRRVFRDAFFLTRVVRALLNGDSRAGAALEGLVAEPESYDHVFRREGDFWMIAYAGRVTRIRHARGLVYLAYLLCHPGERVAAVRVRRSVVPHARRFTAEQARLTVTKAIKATLARLAVSHPELARHLAVTVRTGSRCAYLPDPANPPHWSTDETSRSSA